MAIENLITEHIDIWTSAIQNKSSSGRGSSKKIDLYGIKKLRELILELAVRGKLVPQDPNDEPASVLLERIDDEKAEKFKNGQLKKIKKLPAVSDSEKNIDLPNGWGWTRIGEISEFVNGYAFKSAWFQEQGIGIVKIGDISSAGVLTPETMSRVDPSVVSELDSNLRVACGDLVIAMSGATTGKLGFNCSDEVFYLNQRVGKFIPYQVSLNYLFLTLTTKIAENLAKSVGSAIPNLSTSQINEIVIALPPSQEQHRIVAKVDELMALCDQLEQQTEASIAAHQVLVETLLATLTNSKNAEELIENWQRISAHFDTLFTTEESIDQLKQTILQLAVMGKLVPQDPNDEPASVLLDRIAEEKAQLVKDGKIKRQKALPPITDDEKPFELPEGWEWERLTNISHKITDGAHHTPKYIENGVPFLSVKDMSSGKIDFSDTRYISQEQHLELYKRCNPEMGDLLLTKVGTTGIPILIETEKEFSLFVSVALIKFPVDKINGAFLSLLIKSPLVKSQSDAGTQGVGNKNLVLKTISNFSLIIPPLEEQDRIVAKVDELMALCDQLKARLSDAQTTQFHLTDAIIEQAI
jgi:type I restriction enzyme S subunit